MYITKIIPLFSVQTKTKGEYNITSDAYNLINTKP